MPSNRSNNERGKAFDIDTKIEYMNKLYEVRESNQCCDCSLATICSSSDISAGDRNDDALSRDKRINIFGECSSLRRLDKKSVVFVEIPKDNNNDKYYKIEPLFRDDNPSRLKSVEFDLPNGYVIDKDNSDLDKGIIRFKRKWLSIKEIYDSLFDRKEVTYRQNLKDFSNSKMLVIANLMDIVNYFNGDWKFNPEKDNHGYAIAFYYNTTEYPQYNVIAINSISDIYYGNPVFKNEADAQYVIDNPNFRDILDKIFKV